MKYSIEPFTQTLFSPLAKSTLIHKSVSVMSTVMEKNSKQNAGGRDVFQCVSFIS